METFYPMGYGNSSLRGFTSLLYMFDTCFVHYVSKKSISPLQDWAEFNAATSTIDGLRPSVRSPAASPRHSPLASRRAPAPAPHENAYGELRAPPLPPRKSLSPAEPAILAASSVQDITAHTIQGKIVGS